MISPNASSLSFAVAEMPTAQPPSVLAEPGACPSDVGSGVDAASSLAVGQCRFSSVQASANQFEPIAIASWRSFISTTGRPTAFGEKRSDVEAPRPFE